MIKYFIFSRERVRLNVLKPCNRPQQAIARHFLYFCLNFVKNFVDNFKNFAIVLKNFLINSRRFLQLKEAPTENVIARMIEYSDAMMPNFEDVVRTMWVRDVMGGRLTRRAFNMAGHMDMTSLDPMSKSMTFHMEHVCLCQNNGQKLKVFDTAWFLPLSAAKSRVGIYSPRRHNDGKCDRCPGFYVFNGLKVPSSTWLLAQNLEDQTSKYTDFLHEIHADPMEGGFKVFFELFAFGLATRRPTGYEDGVPYGHQVALIKTQRGYWLYDNGLPEGRPVRQDPRQINKDYFITDVLYFRR